MHTEPVRFPRQIALLAAPLALALSACTASTVPVSHAGAGVSDRSVVPPFGHIVGRLVRLGGTAPGKAVGIPGRVVLSQLGESGSFIYGIGRNGTFNVPAPAGFTYRVTCYSAEVMANGREELCTAAHTVEVPSRVGPKGFVVIRGVEVVCPIK